MAYFCEQQIDILQIISKEYPEYKELKKLLESQQTTSSNLQETQLFRTCR